MSQAAEPASPGSHLALFDYALKLHRDKPDEPFTRYGTRVPLPDDDRHPRTSRPPAPGSHDQGLRGYGAAAAEIIDGHFARVDAHPADLAEAMHQVAVPYSRNAHIEAAGLRADEVRVRQTARWLVRRGTDRCAVRLGLGLFTTLHHSGDIPLIQTIGLLPEFGSLAVDALERRPNSTEALQWLAVRTNHRSRMKAVLALCHSHGSTARQWLLRRACVAGDLGGDFFEHYYAGTVATTAHLHEAITAPDPDSELVDHAGRLLVGMSGASGMGLTLEHYPPADAVLAAYVEHTGRLEPTVERYCHAALLADHLRRLPETQPPYRRQQLFGDCLGLVNRPDWIRLARMAYAAEDPWMVWFVKGDVVRRLGLRALTEP